VRRQTYTVTFMTTEHICPLDGTKLYSLLIEAYMRAWLSE